MIRTNKSGSKATFKSAAILTIARLVGAGAGFVTQLLLARYMLASELGVFYILTSTVIVSGAICALGYPGIANRLVVRYTQRKQCGRMEAFIRVARRDALVLSAGTIIALVAVASAGIGGLSNYFWPAVVASMSIPAFAMLRLNGGIANASQLFPLATLPDNFIRPILFLAVLAAIAALNFSLNLFLVIGVFSVLAIVIAAAQHSVLRNPQITTRPPARMDPRLSRLWRYSGMSLMAPLVIASMFADIAIMASGFLMDPDQVAHFGLAAKIAFLLGFLVQISHQVVTPKLAEALLNVQGNDLKAIISATNLPLFGIILFCLVVIGISGEYLLGWFGEEYSTGATSLTILAICQLVRVLGGPSLPLLIASGSHKKAIPVLLASLAALGFALVLLTPSHGAFGAALAVLAATIVWCGGLAVVVYRELGVFSGAIWGGQPMQEEVRI